MAYYFRVPTEQELTLPQRAAVNEVDPVAISGGPGTGKSVVALLRHLNNYNIEAKSLLLTYTTTLTQYLKGCCKVHSEAASRNIRPALRGCPRKSEKFDEVIIDEAQDLGDDEVFGNYYQNIQGFTVSYGADDDQILYPEHSTSTAELRAMYPENVEYVLDKNFRSTFALMRFAKEAFEEARIPQNLLNDLQRRNLGELPTLFITNGNPKFDDDCATKRNDAINEIVSAFSSDTHNIAILVPFKNDVKEYDEILSQFNIEHSFYYESSRDFPNGCEEIENVHVTTYKSAKGLEFDTVIIPAFDQMERLCDRFDIINWNDFFVAVTRARANLYLFASYDMPQLNGVVEIEKL